jgi:hypothetical protein
MLLPSATEGNCQLQQYAGPPEIVELVVIFQQVVGFASFFERQNHLKCARMVSGVADHAASDCIVGEKLQNRNDR